jgi:signal peptidase
MTETRRDGEREAETGADVVTETERATAVATRDWLATARRVGTVLGTLVLIAAVIPFVVFAVPQVVGANHGFVILSGSMEPTMSPGDVVIVDASGGVEVGDVITFWDGREVPTTHRVTEVRDGQFLTQGDANQNPDSQPVSPEDVLGTVAFTIPLIGYVILWVNTPVGYVTLVLVPLLLLGGGELLAWARRGDDEPTMLTEQTDVTQAESDVTQAESDVTPAEADAKPAESDVTDAVFTDTEAVAVPAGTEQAETTMESSAGTVAVAAADLKLTSLATAVLLAYAGWNVYGEISAGTAPSPISVAVVTAGLLGLLAAGLVTFDARRGAADDSVTPTEEATSDSPEALDTDGSSEPAALRPVRAADGGRPTEATDVNTETADTSTEALDTPTEALDTPTEALDTPTEALDTPTEALDTPTATSNTSTETPGAHTEPVVSDSAPVETDGDSLDGRGSLADASVPELADRGER